ncbi:MAG TPA: exodeoxyribonuclease III [Candidatus Dojkabacteria bacterium]|nr:exodeoxyribonuclease III [Candidatus Dojkabacteria bacterium]
MKIYSWNVNSLRNCENKFLEFLDKYQPDIVGLQELRAHPDQLSFFLKSVSSYEALFNDSGRPGYGGTALYYKSDIGVENISKSVNNKALDDEGRVIFLKVNDIYVFNFYTPNGNMNETRFLYKQNYYNEILKLAKKLRKENKKVIIIGDLNVAHTQDDVFFKNPRTSGFMPQEREWFSNMLKTGYVDTFRMFNKEIGNYSWWNLRDPLRSLNQGWRFDYILVSDNLKDNVKAAGISREVFGSDHCPVWVELESI